MISEAKEFKLRLDAIHEYVRLQRVLNRSSENLMAMDHIEKLLHGSGPEIEEKSKR